MTIPVIALPGGVAPAAARYAPLVAALGGEAELHTKDLEVYAGDEPPAGYSIEQELEAVVRFADALALDRFHLIGYSGGGFVALAFAGSHPGRLLSLALFEPAAIPGTPTEEEARLRRRLDAELRGLAGADFMRAFMQGQVRPGATLAPPAGPPQPWMRKRPAGLRAMMGAFDAYRFDRDSLRRCDFPVFLGHGELSGEQEEVRAGVLARLLQDVRVRRFAGVHHFVSPEELYSPEHVDALRDLWTRTPASAAARGGSGPGG